MSDFEKTFIADVAGATQNPATLEKQDKLFDANRLAGLTFAQTINTGAFFETAWFDARNIPWLQFKGEIPASGAFTAELTSSTAEDPNSPGAEDFTSVAAATIAGTALGAPNNTPSFGFAGHAWVKLKLTNLTGSNHAVKVVTNGYGSPQNPAIIPIGAGVTRDYGAMLTRGAIMALYDGAIKDVGADSAGNLFVRSVAGSEAPEHDRIQAVVQATTGNATVLAAPGAGKQYVLDGYVITGFNSSTISMREFILRDTDATGTIRAPHVAPSTIAGGVPTLLQLSPTLPTPIVFGDNAAIFLHQLGGTGNCSLLVSGYIRDTP